jgi:O-antigen/teichoic acid export membrane protein
MGILLARWMVPEEYGAYALAFSIFLFLSGFHNALLLEPMSVFGPASYGKCLPAYVGKLLGLHFVLAFFLSGLIVAGIAVLRHSASERALVSALWGVCLATPLILFFWLCRRATYLKLAPGLAAGGASVYCLVVIGLLSLVKSVRWLSTFTAFLIQSLAATAAAIVLLAFLRPRLNSASGPFSSAVVRQHWQYGRWVVATVIVYWLSGNAYYVIVAAFLQMRDVAALRALQNFSLPFGQFLTAIGLLVLPWASARFAEEGRAGFRRRVRQITLLFTGMASVYYAFLWLFGGRLMGFLYAGRYREFSHLLTLVVAPVVVLAASQGSTIAVQATQAPADVFLAYSVSGTLTILAGVALARCWGLEGALIGILASSLGFCIVITWRCQKRLKAVVSLGILENRQKLL